MKEYSVGTLVAIQNENLVKPIKVGLITENEEDVILIKWLWYDRGFFLEDEDSHFIELNKEMLLSPTHYDLRVEFNRSFLRPLNTPVPT